ncbi:MAG: hypothetical protein KJ904_10085 [Alphaproteobacteria bacterium]|nr:hypothetical protein [Alphaproteobacteria bacterium]MBU0797629.1 hypothetical protein [Alphaproteobacteria bacterium]MBU0887503.1 hypothetical protein [Alphaproteobacteria bacterium]MBU1814740.1 hypothetical protein [Alphaproteobacteria bacterium]
MTVLYTPGQLRSAISIAPETYRHWKKALAPLRRGRGHSPCFSSGDLVAVSVIRALAVDMGIRVGALAAISEMLFELCNLSPWAALERAKLVVDVAGARLQLRPELAEIVSDLPLITIPLGPVVARLREQLLAASESSEQTSLLFPPIPVNATASANGGLL